MTSQVFWKAIITFVLSSVVLLVLILVFFLWKGVAVGERIQFENAAPRSFVTSLKNLSGAFFGSPSVQLQADEDGRINILLLGRAGEAYPGRNLTDTVMIMSIDTHTKQVALLSLPRDLYVPITDTTLYTKLNSLYQYGLSSEEGTKPLKQTLERITGSTIHYFVILDFDGFEKVIDTLGGISVDVPRDFYDTRYPGKNYSYETFELKKGWQTLDGKTALKYVRERHADPEGDFGRAKRQQQVIQAAKNKALSLGTLFNVVTINRLLDTLGDSVRTNLSLEEMASFLDLARTLDTKNVTTMVVDAWKKESLLRVSHIQVGDIAAFILVPRVGNWSEITDVSQNIFARDELQKRRRAIEAEEPTLSLYYPSAERTSAERMATLLRDELTFAQVSLIPLSPVDNQPEESIIVEQTNLTKPYSLDELLKRFSLTRASKLPFVASRTEENDFTIVMGSDLAETFSLSDTSFDSATDDPTFTEPLPPQSKQKKKK